MEITPSEIEKILALLAETPHRIKAASEGMEDARLYWRPDEKSWSANDILAHLRSCMDVWGKSVGRMLTEENGTQTHISPRGSEIQSTRKWDFVSRCRNLPSSALIFYTYWDRWHLLIGRARLSFKGDSIRFSAKHDAWPCMKADIVNKSKRF